MESFEEVWSGEVGRVVLAASFRRMSKALPLPFPMDEQASERDPERYLEFVGPKAFVEHNAWLARVCPQVPTHSIASAVDWLVEVGFRADVIDGLKRAERSRAEGVEDVVVPWLFEDAFTRRDDVMHGPGILAFDLSLALDLLIVGLALRDVERDIFWEKVRLVLERMSSSFTGWSDYADSFRHGHHILWTTLDPDGPRPDHTSSLTPSAFENVPWISEEMLAEIPQVEQGWCAVLPPEQQRALCGLRVERMEMPGPLWMRAHRRHFQRSVLLGWPFLAIFSIAVASALVAYVTSHHPAFWAAMGFWITLMIPPVMTLFARIRAFGRVASTGSVRTARGNLSGFGGDGPNDLQMIVAEEYLPDEPGGWLTMVLAPDQDVVIAINDVFLPTPCRVTLLPIAHDAPNEPVTSIVPASEPGQPSRRVLSPEEKRHLKVLIQAYRQQLRMLEQRLALLSLLVVWGTVGVAFSAPGWIVLPLFLALGVGYGSLKRYGPIRRIVRQLVRDLKDSFLLVESLADPKHRDLLRPTPLIRAELLPHSARLWRFGGVEAVWRV